MDKTFGYLVKDHNKIREIIEDLLSTSVNNKKQRQELLLHLKEGLQKHEKIEDTVAYSKFEEKKSIKNLTLEAEEKHHVADLLLEELEELDFADERWKAKLEVLKENLLKHFCEEEKKIFPKASEVLKQEELDQIHSGIQKMKSEKTK